MQMFRGIDYLKIDVANSFGLDKKDWSERLQWYDDNQHQLLKLMSKAENHAQYYAGVKAMELIKAGKKNTGYLISLDATSSGIQILSVLTGDRKAAEVCNVVDTGHRRDAYTDLFQVMKQKVPESCQSLFARKQLKDAIMTAFYGSEKVPKELFGEGKLLCAFYETLEQEAPYVWALNKFFLKMWDPTRDNYTWELPDNFHVVAKVMDTIQDTFNFMRGVYTLDREVNQPTPRGRSIGANVTHSVDGFIVREMLRRCKYDPAQKNYVQQLIIDGPSIGKKVSQNTEMVRVLWDQRIRSGYLSARILDYLDDTNINLVNTDDLQDLLDSMPERPFDVLPVHDCFKVHPNYGNDLRKQYNLQLSLISKSNMLSYVLTQFMGKHVPINKQSDITEEVLHADYALS